MSSWYLLYRFGESYMDQVDKLACAIRDYLRSFGRGMDMIRCSQQMRRSLTNSQQPSWKFVVGQLIPEEISHRRHGGWGTNNVSPNKRVSHKMVASASATEMCAIEESQTLHDFETWEKHWGISRYQQNPGFSGKSQHRCT